MNELITKENKTPIEIALSIDDQGMTTAKALYSFLELDPKNYARWFRNNLEKNKFAEEGEDYFPFLLNEEWGGRVTKDARLTANFAKKLSMYSSTEKGELAREYFLTCERIVKDNILKLKKENEKLKLLTVSPVVRFSHMNPKYNHLQELTGLSRKELYKLIYKEFYNKGINLSEYQIKYCYERQLSECYTMTAIQEDPKLFIMLYDIVDYMLDQYA